MNPDNDLHCAPASDAPANEASVKTEIIDRGGRSSSKTKAVIGLLIFALLAGTALAVAFKRSGGGAASTSVGTATGEKPSEDVAKATNADVTPAECVGDLVDAQRKWYCEDFLPFAKKAAADHDRLDRLEAAGKESGSPEAPLALWIVVICVGVLTVYNIVRTHARTTPPTG